MMKWYNVELERKDADVLRRVLKENKIKYDICEAFNLIHFEVYCDIETLDFLNNILEGL